MDDGERVPGGGWRVDYGPGGGDGGAVVVEVVVVVVMVVGEVVGAV